MLSSLDILIDNIRKSVKKLELQIEEMIGETIRLQMLFRNWDLHDEELARIRSNDNLS